MVEPQPTKKPIWNTGGANRTEPTAGEKVAGWALNDQPPSSYFNWLQYYAGAWITWLNERFYKGSNEHDLIINALQPAAPGAGGDLDVKAGDGLGTDQPGGITAVESGISTGTASTWIDFNVSEAETGGSGSGSYQNPKGRFMRMDGTSGLRTTYSYRYLQMDNPTAVDAARGTARYIAKAQPTSPQLGDIYLDSGTNRLRYHDGAGYRDANTLFGAPFYVNSDNATDSAQEVAFVKSAVKYLFTIPANYLSAGSLIRFRFECYRQGTALADDPGLRFRVGPVGSHAVPPTGAIAALKSQTTLFSYGNFSADGEIYVVTAGSPGLAACATRFTARAAGSGSWDAEDGYVDRRTFSINTTIANEIFPAIYWLAVGTGTEFCVATYYSLQVT